ncbi:hypothetical protein J437_LFUL017670 [Ladona fulva]|uniref:Reverse transcriptase RNase H-like domain-containing protein n=1 Tax=Ladona fulva TaxID=123851 RepID=A0A8K0KR46_LADFU|nr:hypothetical protein J437_LFUL017670 [Ladona fulva]
MDDLKLIELVRANTQAYLIVNTICEKTSVSGIMFVLRTDVSSHAIAAVLSQTVHGHMAPIAFASRTPRPKRNIPPTKPDGYEFDLFTDNATLSWMRNHPKQLGKVGRWILRLSTFKFVVKHIRGCENVVADCLSRMYGEGEAEELCWDRWDEQVHTLMIAFNSAIHERTGYSLASMPFGQELNHPLDMQWGLDGDIERAAPTPPMEEKWVHSLKNLQRACKRSERRYKVGRGPHHYREGQKVVYRLHPMSSGPNKKCANLFPKWSPPYVISRFLGSVTAEVSDRLSRLAQMPHNAVETILG